MWVCNITDILQLCLHALISIVTSRIYAFCWSNPPALHVLGVGVKLKQVITKDDDVDCYDSADVLATQKNDRQKDSYNG